MISYHGNLSDHHLIFSVLSHFLFLKKNHLFPKKLADKPRSHFVCLVLGLCPRTPLEEAISGYSWLQLRPITPFKKPCSDQKHFRSQIYQSDHAPATAKVARARYGISVRTPIFLPTNTSCINVTQACAPLRCTPWRQLLHSKNTRATPALHTESTGTCLV